MGSCLINLEGIDQAGKGTQAALLAGALTGAGLSVAAVHFHVRETPLGKMIDEFLAGRVHLPPAAVQMLYSANRYEVREELLAPAADVLILDRYCPSGWAYGMALGLDERWLRNLDAGLPEAGLTILLDLPPEVAAARKKEKDVLERDIVFQGRVSEAYRHLAAVDGWAVVDARGKADEVGARVLAAVREATGLVSRR